MNVTNLVGPSMTNLYYQCRTERESTFKNNATELGGCASFGFEAGGEKSQDWLSRVRQARIRQVLHGILGLSGIRPGQPEHLSEL